jgi:hypothetical protein
MRGGPKQFHGTKLLPLFTEFIKLISENNAAWSGVCGKGEGREWWLFID